jgi:CelD/BcsL family acetyltransferase involved in cellulose biosynthesis
MRAHPQGGAAPQASARPTLAPADAPVAVVVLRDRGAISALRDEWERLAAAVAADGGPKGPFLAPAWLAIYAAALTDPRSPARVGDFRLLVAHRGGRLVGALPLVVERRALAGMPARLLRSLSDDHSQRFDVLLAPGRDGDEAARALITHLARARDWDAVELQSVPEGHSGAARLVAAARAGGLTTGTWPAMVSPFLPLPATEAELERCLDSKFRGNLRRRAKKLAAAHGPLALERLDGRVRDAHAIATSNAHAIAAAPKARALDAALDEGFALEAAGWKGARGTAIACDRALTSRYRALAHAFATRGQLACYFLTVGGRRVAFHFALIDNDTYYLFKPGFAPALASFGPGHLLVDLVARDLIARGVRELDFLGDDMPWKREWTLNVQTHNFNVRAHNFVYLFAPSRRGWLLAHWKLRLAPALKHALARGRALAGASRTRLAAAVPARPQCPEPDAR